MRRLIGCFSLLLLISCGSGGDGDGTQCSEAASQGLSQPCCLDHGIDACGANLFCAAFDGRKQATCYPERSRLDLQSCAEDRHCVSGSCNIDAAACRSLPSTNCDRAIGCANDPTGGRYLCLDETETCRAVGNGKFDALCLEKSDCHKSYDCIKNRCTYTGQVCGELKGTGPCLEEPEGYACADCRMDAHRCNSDECWDLRVKLNNCLAGFCDDTADPQCATASCGFQLCNVERCAAGGSCPWVKIDECY